MKYTNINYFRSYRLKHGLSQKQMAIILGCKTTAAISLLEKGKRQPNINQLIQYCVLFDTDVENLLPTRYLSIKATLQINCRNNKTLLSRSIILKDLRDILFSCSTNTNLYGENK